MNKNSLKTAIPITILVLLLTYVVNTIDSAIITSVAIVIFATIIFFILLFSSKKTSSVDDNQYKKIIDNSTDIFWSLDLNTMRFTYIGGKQYSALHYTEEFLRKKDFKDYFPLDSYQKIQAEIGSITQSYNKDKNQPVFSIIEAQQYNTYGQLIWVEISATFLPNENDELDSVIGVTRAIGGRKRAEAKLLETINQFNNLANNINDVLWYADFQTFTIDYVNSASFEIFGLFPEEMIGHSVTEFFTPETIQIFQKVIENATKQYLSGEVSKMQATIETEVLNVQTKTLIAIELMGTIHTNENDEFVGIYGVTRDITKRKQMEYQKIQDKK